MKQMKTMKTQSTSTQHGTSTNVATEKINDKPKVKQIYIDRWFYNAPDMSPNKEGNRVLISQASFGPLETWEWGIDSNNKFYVDYKWIENDFYADDSFHEERSLEEVKDVLNSFIKTLADNGHQDWVEVYNNLLMELEEEFQKI